MANWTYVAIAYAVVWGSLALYALVLARRVAQAREVARRLPDAATSSTTEEPESRVCNAPPAP